MVMQGECLMRDMIEGTWIVQKTQGRVKATVNYMIGVLIASAYY